MKNTSSLLRFWLDDWSRRFGAFKEGEIRELIFQRSFINIAKAVTLALESAPQNRSTTIPRNKKDSWIKGLLELLESYFDSDHPVIKLVSLEYKKEIKVLAKELKASSFDTAKIYPPLSRIKDGLSPATIGAEFAKQFALDGNADTDYLGVLSEVLIQSQIGRNSLSDLKGLPQQTVAHLGAEIFLETIFDRLCDDADLTQAVWNNYPSFLRNEIAEGEKLETSIVKDSVNAFDLINTFHWQNLFRKCLSSLSEMFRKEMKKLLGANDLKTIITIVETDSDLHDRVGQKVFVAYAGILAQGTIFPVTDQPTRDEHSDLAIGLLPLSDWLRTNALFKSDREPSETRRRADIVDLVAAEAFDSAAIRAIGTHVSKVIGKRFETSAQRSVGRRLCCLLARDLGEAEIDTTRTLRNALVEFLEQWHARIDLHRNLGVIFLETNSLLLREIVSIITSPQTDALFKSSASRRTLYRDWRQSFISHAAFSSYVYKHFPWDRLTATQLKHFIESVIAEFDNPTEEWSVLFTIKRLKSKGRIWSIGGVRFYDPDVFDLRDARLFKRETGKVVTVGEVKVRAVSRLDAARTAWKRLNLILNNTAFALSLDKMTGGFEIERDAYVYVRRTEKNSSSAGAMLTRNESAIVQSVDAIESWVTPKFGRLIARIEQGSWSSELEARFLRAIHWYNKGRWKEDAAETFVYYWIGIETLFGGIGQQALFEQMSQLTITWRNAYSYGNYGLRPYWDDLVKKLKADPVLAKTIDGSSRLKNWDRDRRVLADHRTVKRLIKLIPVEESDVRSYAQNYLEYLLPFVAHRKLYEEEVEVLRSEFRFKLLLLKGLRNDIAHFGVHEHPALDLYANEIQAIFEDVLVRVGNGIINEVPRHATIDSLINEFNEWWVK